MIDEINTDFYMETMKIPITVTKFEGYDFDGFRFCTMSDLVDKDIFIIGKMGSIVRPKSNNLDFMFLFYRKKK